VHWVPYAEDRANPRRRERPQPHVSFREPRCQRSIKGAERMQRVSHRQEQRVDS